MELGNTNGPKTTEKGKLILIDPNPPGRDVVPTEDLFMYVKFRAIARGRSAILQEDNSGILNQESNSDQVINFISTNVKYGNDGKTILNDGISYATTDFTEMGGLSSGNNPGGVVEGFGIKSIDIKYNASLVPQVDVTFIDVRGSSLFDVIDQDNRKSPYSIFFKLPYPVFELTLKGYFGKPVTYCLHMTKWNSSFDGSSGNFEIKANFLGFQQAFLADIKMENVIGVINTDEGKQNLSRLKIKVKKLDTITNKIATTETSEPTPHIDAFLNDISRIQVDLASLKSNSEDFQTLTQYNTIVNLLEELSGFIGKPIPIDPKNKGFRDKDTTTTEKINEDDLKLYESYLSIRDIIVVKETKIKYFNEWASVGTKLESQYKEYLTENNLKNNLTESIFTDGDADGNTVDPTPFIENVDENDKLKFKDFVDQFFDPSIVNGLYEKITTLTEFSPVDAWAPLEEDPIQRLFLAKGEFRKQFTGENKFNLDDFVLIYDLGPMRIQVQKELTYVKEKRDEKKKEVIEKINEELAKKLGFNPTIRDVFNIIMNNVQAMLETIHEISVKAEEKTEERYKNLVRNKIVTDIPGIDGSTQPISTNNKKQIYAWTGVYGLKDEKLQAKWLGDENIDESVFPEVKFVEDVIDGYVKSTAELKRNRELVASATKNNSSNNWLPINPEDIGSNPYAPFASTDAWKKTSEDDIPTKFHELLLKRAFTLRDYSNISGKLFKSYAMIEGGTAALSVTTPIYRSRLNELLKGKMLDSAIKYGKEVGLIQESGSGFIMTDSKASIGDTKISGDKTNSDIDFLKIGNNTKPIIQNNSYLDTKITTNFPEFIKTIKDEKQNKSIEEGIFTFHDSNLYRHNISYLVYPKGIVTEIMKDKEWSASYKLEIDDISKIDGKNLTPQTTDKSSGNLYLGKLPDSDLIGSDIWDKNSGNKYSQALLLLSTIPYLKFQDVIEKYVIKEKFNIAKILVVPTLFMAWFGGTLWRNKQTIDPLVPGTPPVKGVGNKNEYITIAAAKKFYDNSSDKYIAELPSETKNELINFFIKWVDGGGFDKFEKATRAYIGLLELPTDKRNSSGTNLLSMLSQEQNLVIVTPKIFNPPKTNLFIEKTDLETYFNSFATGFSKFKLAVVDKETNPSENDDGKNSTDKTTNNSDLKASMYGYFKEIYDKWLGGTPDGKIFNICGASIGDGEKQLIDYFNFIDRAWSDIGDKAVINLDSVTTLADNPNSNLYYYISKLLRDSNFIFQILPTFINFKDAPEVEKMFTPITDISDENSSTGPAYVCIYAGGQSKSLDIGERYEYSNDGFDIFNEPPPDMESEPKIIAGDEESYKLVAFRVAFGSENQTIFKNVSLNQEEHKTTGEYIKQLANLVDKRSGVQRAYQGTDLYSLFAVRSYTCKVEALGCMNIQPLMYFQLDNVPFYTGAYLITSVEHSITPNHMTTSFTGLRQSSFVSPVVDTSTTFLNIDFNEIDEVAQRQELSNLNGPDTGVDYNFVIANPTGPFPFTDNAEGVTAKITPTTLQGDIGVQFGEGYADNYVPSYTDLSVALNKYLPEFGLDTNGKVLNFMAQCMHESINFSHVNEIWSPRSITDADSVPGKRTPADNSTQDGYENKKSLGNGKINGGQIDDGFRLRGRGYIQVTGRENYGKLSIFTTSDGKQPFKDVLNNPSLINASVDSAVLASIIWYTKIGSRSIPGNAPTNKGTVAEATYIGELVNGAKKGAANGANDRLKKLEKLTEAFALKAEYDG